MFKDANVLTTLILLGFPTISIMLALLWMYFNP